MTNYFELIDFFNDGVGISFVCISNKSSICKDTNKASKVIKIDANKLAIPVQEHTNIVKWVTSSGIYKKCDGLISNLDYDITLSLSVADCTPVCLFDPITKNYGLVHSGWKGTSKKISNKAVEEIINKGSKIEDILVYLGPSISDKNYEVGIEVAQLFNNNNYMPKGNKYLLDIKSQIKDDLVRIGIKPDSIDLSNVCTYDESNLCSYRRDGSNAGRIIFLMGKYNGRN